MAKLSPVFPACILLFVSAVAAQIDKSPALHNYLPTKTAIERLEKDIPNLMQKANVPGMSVALIRNGKLVWDKGFGVKNASTKEPVTTDTVFEAASLSKVVFAYGVMKLVDEGKLDLDVPLNKYLGNNYDVGDDERLNLITARRVLSHTSGFPNWRPEGSKTLLINFTPGEKFSYSGEGFEYLSKVVQKITGMNLEDFMQKTALRPLGMTSSSYAWQDSYADRAVYRHDWLGGVAFRDQRKGGNAAASLRTTAEDYARFVIALLKGTGLKKKTSSAMLTPQIKVGEKWPTLFWELGVGMEVTDEGNSFWQWGDQPSNKAYMTAFLPHKDAIIFFTDSENGLSFPSEIVEAGIGGKHPALSYIGFPRYDSQSWILLNAIASHGSGPALKDYVKQREQNDGIRLNESQMNVIGQRLLNVKKIDDAIEVFKQNVADFPQSSKALDSLAGAYMTKNDKVKAIESYEKSIKLDSQNKHAVEMLGVLKNVQ